MLNWAGYAVNEAISSYGQSVKSKLTKIAREIYTQIQGNQKKLDKLYDAYNDNKGSLQSILFSGSGFGPRTQAIYDELARVKSEFETAKDKITDKQTKLNNDYNEVSNAQYQAGNGLVSSLKADEIASKMNQYVEGGLTKNE